MSKITEMKIHVGRTAQVLGDYVKIELEATVILDDVMPRHDTIIDDLTRQIDDYINQREDEIGRQKESKSCGEWG